MIDVQELADRRMTFGNPRPRKEHFTGFGERREVNLPGLASQSRKPRAGLPVKVIAFRHAE